MENITKDPNIVFCKICGAMLTWEYPEGSGHYQASSDFIGGDICRSCLAERQEIGCSTPEFPYSAGQTGDISESVEHVQIALFQAPFASLHEHGLLIKMYDREQPFTGPVPSQYYMPVFSGEIEIRGMLPKEPQLRTSYILEQFYCLYNRDDRPNPMTSRSLSVGDVVQLENQFFLCSAASFIPVAFEPVAETAKAPADTLIMPNGTVLQVKICSEDEYPCINIDLVQADGENERVCFVEHNPEKELGQELCIGVYCSTEEDTVYYSSYNQGDNHAESL